MVIVDQVHRLWLLSLHGWLGQIDVVLTNVRIVDHDLTCDTLCVDWISRWIWLLVLWLVS